MYKTKLCLGASKGFGIDIEDQIKLFHQTGFEGFFTDWDENLKKYRALADELGMEYQSVHAPFKKVAKIWQGGEEAEAAVAAKLTPVNLGPRILRCETAPMYALSAISYQLEL